MGITFIFWLKALKEAPNTATVSNLVFLSPFISLIIISISIKRDYFTFNYIRTSTNRSGYSLFQISEENYPKILANKSRGLIHYYRLAIQTRVLIFVT